MRHAIFSLVMLCFAAGASVAQQTSDPAIESTISRQFDAFMKDDVETAFSFASPGIKGIFGTADRFGAMVQNGYPMVWRPSDVKFLELREISGALWQRVMVTDQSGQTHMLDYQMIPSADGWQINAVQLLPAVDVGA